MGDTVINFGGGNKKIGLIVRGKQGPDNHAGSTEQLQRHADAILADGSPIGFFGEGPKGLRMQGVAYDYAAFRRHRPWYVDKNSAVSNRVVSTVLIIDVDKKQADAFAAAWAKMKQQPGDFNIIGGNCATHASAAFISAGILDSTIPWLDTPDNLYDQLVDTLPAGRLHSYTGYIGFKPAASGGYNLVIASYAASPAVNTPNPGSSGSLSTNSSSK